MSDDIRTVVKNNANLYRAVEEAQEANRHQDKNPQHITDVLTLDPEIVQKRKDQKNKKKK